MNNQVLSIKQMQELINMGIDTSKASMYSTVIKMDSIPSKVIVSKDYATYWMENSDIELTPTFTLQDILEILPRELKPFIGNRYWKKVWLELRPYAGTKWCIEYASPDELFHRVADDNPLDAAFNMLKWCKQNNYI